MIILSCNNPRYPWEKKMNRFVFTLVSILGIFSPTFSSCYAIGSKSTGSKSTTTINHQVINHQDLFICIEILGPKHKSRSTQEIRIDLPGYTPNLQNALKLFCHNHLSKHLPIINLITSSQHTVAQYTEALENPLLHLTQYSSEPNPVNHEGVDGLYSHSNGTYTLTLNDFIPTFTAKITVAPVE